MDVLSVKNLTRRFGDKVAVDDVSLHIAAGETFGLLGPNGAGKTTTISMVAGLLSPDAGTIAIKGEAPSAHTRSLVGLVPQDIALYPDLSAAENLRFFGGLQGLSGKHLADRTARVLDVVGLADRAKDRIETYSGGMRRRANIAVGLLHEPQLLILDEPTVGVDPQSRNSILEAVDALGASGMAVLYTTHYMEEAERLCDRIAIMDQGALIAEGTRDELVADIGEQSTIDVRTNMQVSTQWAEQVSTIEGVSAATIRENTLHVVVDRGPEMIAPIVQSATEAGITVSGVEVVEPDLETVFLHLTGKVLRD